MNDIIISMNYLSSKIADTNDLFKRLGVKDNTLTKQILFLNENGYLIIPPTSLFAKTLKVKSNHKKTY